MKPDITEFSYGFALTSNLMDRFSLHAAGAPIFPNLYQEGTTGGGYDVQLPRIAVFLKFKLADHMVRRSALGAGILGVPHFRFELRALKHSIQHTLLLYLEAAGNEVYYCAPHFHLAHELNDAFSANRVPDRTAFFSPTDIGALPDEHEHFVAFRPDRNTAWLFSDPKELHYRTGDAAFGPNARRRPGSLRRSGARDIVLRDIGDQLLNVFEQSVVRSQRLEHETRLRISTLRQSRAIPHAAKYAGFVSQSLFGCLLLLIQG